MIDRERWSFVFTEGTTETPWPCPSCASGNLALIEGSLTFLIEAETAAVTGELWWDPHMEKGRFVAAMKCVRKDCGEGVSISGTTEVIELPDEDYTQEQYERRYRMTYMDPPPRLISIPENAPDDVRRLIIDTCRLVWIDPSAAGNRGRAAVEQLLTEHRIPKRKRIGKGKSVELSLAKRIDAFSERHADLGSKLTAMRWVGNVGSHGTKMTSAIVMDGLDILSFVLDELYVGRSKRITRLAKRITSRRGRP